MSDQFGKRGKLSPRFIGPFEILERIFTVAYRLALTPSMLGVHEVFHVSILRKYTPDPAHEVDWGQIEIDTDGAFEEGPVCIVDSREQVLRRKTVRLVRVLWRHCGVEVTHPHPLPAAGVLATPQKSPAVTSND